MVELSDVDQHGLRLALANAQKSYDEGGVPIGAVLQVKSAEATAVLGQGHNQRVQRQSAILHAEIAAFENAGRLSAKVYKQSTMVSGEF